MNELIRKESIEELCGHRARALELYGQGVAMLLEAGKAHARSAPSEQYINGLPDDLARELRYRSADVQSTFAKKMQANIDRDMWKSIIKYTNLGSLMDKQERKAFDEQIEKDPPPFSPDNVLATLTRLVGEADMIFRRGLVNAFEKLCREYKSNDGFKIGERTVITYGVNYDKSCNWFRFCTYAEENLQDVDRVMHVLDGKAAPDYQQGLCAALRQAMSDYRKGGSMEVTTAYWRAKFFKNGNIHLFALRDDLRQKANKLIAEHFGQVVPAGHSAREKKAEDYSDEPREFGVDDRNFFPTPPAVVERLIAAADIRPNHRVLEPSAGEGAIVSEILKITPDLWCYEIDPDRAAKSNAPNLFVDDFLSVPPNPAFDRVVMNPPFTKRQDVLHVIHAFRFLKPGGRLVAVMSNGATYNSSKIYTTFRAWVERNKGTIEALPEGSFKASGTMVNTVMVIFDKEKAS